LIFSHEEHDLTVAETVRGREAAAGPELIPLLDAASEAAQGHEPHTQREGNIDAVIDRQRSQKAQIARAEA